jgi:phosphatidylserine decarboxylase
MRVAREGIPFIIIGAILAGGAIAFAAAWGGIVWWALAGLLTLVALWVVYFFRDPERNGERGDRLVISPADGKIVSVVTVHEPAFHGGPAIRVSVFMNIFSVHVNRYPVSGTVQYVHYNPGKFLNAAVEKASLENEQSSVGIDGPAGRVLVRQIAGLIARRIHGRARQGERFGLIRFGSRVDVFLPTTARVRVTEGQQVYAGLTVLADA